MKLRLFPRQEDAYFGLFQAAADTIAAAATVLLYLLNDLADAETKAKQLAELEHASLEGHHRRHRAGPGRTGPRRPHRRRHILKHA
jgi:hypothetical protein